MLRGLCTYCRLTNGNSRQFDERLKWFGVRLRQRLVRDSWSAPIRERRRRTAQPDAEQSDQQQPDSE